MYTQKISELSMNQNKYKNKVITHSSATHDNSLRIKEDSQEAKKKAATPQQ